MQTIGAPRPKKFATGQSTEVKPTIYRNDYFIAGFDVRGIDQNNDLRGKFEADNRSMPTKKASTPLILGVISASAANTVSASSQA